MEQPVEGIRTENVVMGARREKGQVYVDQIWGQQRDYVIEHEQTYVPYEVEKIVHEKEYIEVPVPVEVTKTQIVEVPVFVEPPKIEPVVIEQKQETSERRVVLPQMKRAEIPQVQTVVEKIVEPPPPVPVIVKTVHDTTVVTEEPTDIHHVELKENKPVRAQPFGTARATAPAPVEESAKCFGLGWWCLLPLLCCLPLCCLPLLLCRKKKSYNPGSVAKPARSATIAQKNLQAKEQPEYKVEKQVEKKKVKRAVVKRVEEPQEDIEVEIERELAKKAVVEETVVVRKEIPVEEYEHQVRKSAVEANQFYRQEGQYLSANTGGRVVQRSSRIVSGGEAYEGGSAMRASSIKRGTNYAQLSPSREKVRTTSYGREQTYQNTAQFGGGANYNSGSYVRATGSRQIYDQPLTEAAQMATGSYGGGGASGFGSYRAGGGFEGSPSRIGQGRIIDSQVVSRKVAKFNPDNGQIDEEVAMDLDNTGHVARATMRSNAGNLRDKDFFE